MRRLPERLAGVNPRLLHALRLDPDSDPLTPPASRQDRVRWDFGFVQTGRRARNCRSEHVALQLRPDGVAEGLGCVQSAPPCRVVEPLAPARYKVQFTASAELHDKLERLRALMRSSVPDGDLAAIIEQAVAEKLKRLESRRFGRAKIPRKALPARRRRAKLCRSRTRLPRQRRRTSALEDPLSPDTPHPGRGEASRIRAGRRPMPLRGRAGPAMHRTRRAGVPPPAPVRPRGRALRRGPLSAVSRSQRLPG